MLGVLLVLAILITVIVSVIGLVQRTTQKQRAETDANALVQAVLHYQQVYGAWPREHSRVNADLFVAGVGSSNIAFFGSSMPFLQPPPSIDQADVVAALLPGNPGENPRNILFLTIAANALRQGRLVDPWGHPYLLVMDAQHTVFSSGALGDLAFSNLPAFAISPGAPAANPTVSNWIFSAGVRP